MDVPTGGHTDRTDNRSYRKRERQIRQVERDTDIDGQEDGRADGRRPQVFYVGVSAVSMSWNGWGSARDKPFSWQLFGGGGLDTFFLTILLR